MLRRALGKAYWTVLRASPPPVAARLSYLRHHGRLPNLAAPRRFTERVFAQKLRGDHARFAELSDKVKVKDYVARTIGPCLVTPTLWHGPSLPPRAERTWPLPFVLKANHGSTMNALVRSQADLDWDELETRAERWLRTDWPAWMCEEWYNDIERQLLVEPLLEDAGGDLPDYKLFVFSGRAQLVQVDSNRASSHTRAFYDTRWERLPLLTNYPQHPISHLRPPHLEGMVEAAEALGRDFEFVRVDFYDLPHGPRFGEMTFTPWSGLVRLRPDSYDVHLGRLWEEGLAAASGRP